MKTIINFISSRTNLTILQCLCYFVIGYIMGEHLTWIKFSIMFSIILLLQFIVRTKAVADGMMYREIMIDNEIDANEIVRRIKEQADIDRKNDNIN